MNHVAIVYWSGTGNTEKMAQCIAEGVQDAGGTAALLGPGEFSADSGGHALRQENRPVRLLRLGRRPVDAGVVPALQLCPAL